MTTWTYTLPGGATGQILAADDDQAWNIVLQQLGQCPVQLTAISARYVEVAA